MTGLLREEVHRLLSRRLVRVTGALVVLGIAVAGVAVAVKSRPASPQRTAEYRASVAEAHRACLQGRLGLEPKPGQTLQEACANLEVGSGPDTRFRLAALPDVLKGTTVPLVVLALLLGASFVGAEWHAGTVTTLLTWEPRRVRVFLARSAVALLAVFAGFLAVQLLLGLVLGAVAATRGVTAGTGRRWAEDAAGSLLRGGALAAVSAAVGVAVATVARNTAAALGVGFGYLLVVENLIGALRPGWRSWFLAPNAVVLVTGQRQPDLVPRSVLEAGVLLGLYAVLALAVAGEWFRRSDVA